MTVSVDVIMREVMRGVTKGTRLSSALAKFNTVLTTDFCPRANGWIYWLKHPFWILVLALLGSALCGIFLNPWLFSLTVLLFVITAAGVLLPWISVRGIRCQVMFDVRRAAFGQPALVRLQIRNNCPFPVWGLCLINGFTGLPRATEIDSDEGVSLARIPAWSTMEYSWPFEPRRRGIYPNRLPEIETSFPFAIFRARRCADVSGQLIVWPETVDLEGLPGAAESQLAEERFSERRSGEFGDTLGTRLFRNGDSLRRVHWAQTARHQTLIVTERQAPAMTTVRLYLDLSEAAHPLTTRDRSIEHCVSIAASICESLHRQQCRVELVHGNQFHVAGDSTLSLQCVLDALAVAGVTDSSPARTRTSRSGFQIVITTAHGFRPADEHAIVVVSSDNLAKRANSHAAWIVLDDTATLAGLHSSWRKACHAD